MLRTTFKATWKPANYPENPQTIGDHIRVKRIDLGLQIKELARQLRANEGSVASWEIGRRQPCIRNMPALLKFLGHDPRPQADGIGGQLRRKRTALGLSLRAAAKEMQIDPSTLARWESGSRQPTGKYMTNVYRFLGIERRDSGGNPGTPLGVHFGGRVNSNGAPGTENV